MIILSEEEKEKLVQISGIGPKTADKLLKNKITLNKLATMRPDELASILKIGRGVAKKVIINAKSLQFKEWKFMTAKEYEEERDKNTFYLSTGAKKVDRLLSYKGGLPSRTLMGLIGPIATGKTQFIYQLLYNAVVKHEKYAVFVETEEGTFSLKRLKEMARARGDTFDGDKVIIYPAERIADSHTQYSAYEFVREGCRERKLDVGFWGVDSFNSLILGEYAGREMFPERSEEIRRHLYYLKEIAKEFNCCMAITCQGGQAPGRDAGELEIIKRFGLNYYPTGGTALLHNVPIWLSLNEVKKNLWRAYMFDNSLRPRGSGEFIISEKGIEDVVEKKVHM